MKMFFSIITAFVFPALALGDSAEFKAIIPADVQVQPLARMTNLPAALSSTAMHLLVNPAGQPFLIAGNHLFDLSATNRDSACFAVGGRRALNSVAWLPDGTLLAVSGSELGELTTTGLTVRCKLPQAGLKIEAASSDKAYIYGGSADGAGGDVYLYRQGQLLHLLHAPTPVTAVAGTGNATFAACGRTIYAMVMGGALTRVDTVAEEVVSLAIVPPTGVFYSTKNTVGYLYDRDTGGYLFLKSAGGALRAGCMEFFLLVPSEGVFRFSNLEGFSLLHQSIDAAASAAVK